MTDSDAAEPSDGGEGRRSGPERTADGRYIVVGGRRWRATDPSIPDALRKELVNELMAARRAVSAAVRTTETAAARARVNDAKIALGERGRAWWEEPEVDDQRRRAGAAILTLVRSRGPGRSICPSDAARVIGSPDWRSTMDLVRDVACELATADGLVVTKGGNAVADPRSARGPIRYTLATAEP